MKIESADALRPEQMAAGGRARLFAAALTLAAVAWLLLWYAHTADSLVAIWKRSETFAHGFLVFPISAWLVWGKRAQLRMQPLQPSWSGTAILLVLGFAWLSADLAHVGVVQQFSLVAMIPALVLAILGWRVVRTLAFPFAFLLLAVPVGEELILPLMNYTADFTVAALRLTGIPVYREGTFFTIPSGSWSVVEGCSGLRYLIASFTAGCLFAYLTYRSWWRRLAFISASLLVPIVANWVRAYLIVMIAHLSSMRLAVGVDHLIYGWVFFGFVMLLLFWVGSYWREEPAALPAAAESSHPAPVDASLARIGIASVLAVIAAGGWPLYSSHVDAAMSTKSRPSLAVPAPRDGWELENIALTTWRPRYQGADPALVQVYRKGDQRVLLFIGMYRGQRPGADLLTTQNIMVVQKHPVWSDVGASHHVERIGEAVVPLRETRLRSVAQRLLVWDWFVIDGRRLSNRYFGKLLLAWEKLTGHPDDGAAVILATPSEENIDHAQAVLRSFGDAMLPAIDAAISAGTR